jgi:hypothetical protein
MTGGRVPDRLLKVERITLFGTQDVPPPHRTSRCLCRAGTTAIRGCVHRRRCPPILPRRLFTSTRTFPEIAPAPRAAHLRHRRVAHSGHRNRFKRRPALFHGCLTLDRPQRTVIDTRRPAVIAPTGRFRLRGMDSAISTVTGPRMRPSGRGSSSNRTRGTDRPSGRDSPYAPTIGWQLRMRAPYAKGPGHVRKMYGLPLPSTP